MRNQKASTPTKRNRAITRQDIEQAQMKMLQEKLRARNLTDPRQLKERIIWDHLKMLVLEIMGKHPLNKDLVDRYEFQFKLAETAENYHGSSRADYVKEQAKSQ